MTAAKVRAGLAADRDAIAWIMDELAIDAGHPIERSNLRRIVDDVIAAWDGRAEDRWTVWTSEVGHSLGRPSHVVDCTAFEAVKLAQNGAAVIGRPTGEHSWIAVMGGTATEVRVLQPFGARTGETVKRRSAERILKARMGEEKTRFVVLDPSHLQPADHATDHDHHGHHDDHGMSPAARLWSLLRPESTDILTVLAFSIVTGILAMATPLAVESLVSTVAFGRMLQPVVILALILFGFLTFLGAILALQTFVTEILQRRLFARIASNIAFRLPRVKVDALEQHYPPELVNRFFEVVTVQKVVSSLLLDGITLVISTLVGMAVLALYHPWLLGFDIVLLALLTFTIFVLGRGAVKTSIKESKAKYRTASWLEDIAACPTAFRYDGAAEFAIERADRQIYDYLTERRKHFRILIRQILFALGLQAIASTVLLGMGGWLVISGQLTLGQLVAAELIVAVIVGAFAKLGKHLESFYDVLASVDKLGQLFDLPIERQDGLVTLPDNDGVTIEMSHISYQYAHHMPGVSTIDWRVERGSRWAITGPDGSGKSTLLDMIYGLRQPAHGTLTINGVCPRELRPDALRRYVALSRGVEIFNGTIAENVHLMRPELTLADVHEALDFVGLLDDVLALPAGVDTHLITGDGRPLTTGRLHRLMIARAVIGRPRLLMIDGTLDALRDEESAEIVKKLIDPALDWTVIVATTRDSITSQMPRCLPLGRVKTPQGVIELEPRDAH